MNPDPITEILLVILALIFGIVIWILLYRYSMVIIVLSLLAFVSRVVFNQEIIILQIRSYNISMVDILSIYFITTAIARLIISKKSNTKMIFGILFWGFLLGFSWVRGVLLFSLELSTNELRIYLYFFATLFYTINLKYTQAFSRKLIFWLGAASVIFVIIAIARWALIALGFVTSYDWIAPNGRMIRVISASATLLLLQMSILTLYFRNKLKGGILNYLIPTFIIIMVIILQHRSVWVALIIAFVLFIGFKIKNPIGIILGVLLSFTFTALLAINNNISLGDLSGTSFDLSSLSWRVLGWKELLAPERFNTILDYLIGQPFGTGYIRYLGASDYATTVSPHNFYIQTFLNIGGLGLLTVLICYGWLLKLLWSQRNDMMSCGFFILLSTQLVYYATYSPSYEQGLILGLAILFVHYNQDKLKETCNKLQTDNTTNEKIRKPILVEP